MSGKLEVFDRYLISQENRLKEGDVLTVALNDGVLTIYKDIDEQGNERTSTLIDQFDAKLNLSINDLIDIKRGGK